MEGKIYEGLTGEDVAAMQAWTPQPGPPSLLQTFVQPLDLAPSGTPSLVPTAPDPVHPPNAISAIPAGPRLDIKTLTDRWAEDCRGHVEPTAEISFLTTPPIPRTQPGNTSHRKPATHLQHVIG